jgi:hypothetical protein
VSRGRTPASRRMKPASLRRKASEPPTEGR